MKASHQHRGPVRSSRSRNASAAFTLVELLVVFGMIALLASLLLPGMAGVRASVHAARCTSNLRQFGLAALMYCDDNEGALFRYRRSSGDAGDVYWFGWMGDGDEGSRLFDPTRGALWPYLAKRGVEVCPALAVNAPDFKLKAALGACGYGYNLQLAAPIDQPPRRITEARHVDVLALFADAAQVNDFQPPASPDRPMIEEFYYVNTTERTAHFRHRSDAAMVLADGHVDRRGPLPGSLDPRLPAARIGRLPPFLLEFP